MALQPCKECGKEISTEAEKCPQCGRSVEKDKIPLFPVVLGGALLLVAITFAVQHTDTESRVSSSPAPPQSSPKQVAPKEVLAEAQQDLKSGQADKVADLVKNLLLDPRYGVQARRLLNQSILKLKDEMAAG